jgi:type II secretory pathway pseudopilin PulG
MMPLPMPRLIGRAADPCNPRHPRSLAFAIARLPNPRDRLRLFPAPPSLPPRRARGAYTLVELLIVVSIMIMLVAVALPVAKKVMEGSQGREASRQLHAYVHMAKARALQTGRPCGLFFQFPTPPLGVIDPPITSAVQATAYWPVRHVTQVFMAEIPPPYSGGTTDVFGKIWDDPSDAAMNLRVFQPVTASGAPYAAEFPLLYSLINPGEIFLVRFNFKGDWYRCVRGMQGVATYSDPSILYFVGPNATIPPGFNDTPSNNSGGKPFQILRSPRPVGNPLELPRGTCIDMTYSGVGNNSRQFPPPPAGLTTIASNLAVMMSPNGGVDSMYVNGAPTMPPTGSLYFLIGKVEKAESPYQTFAPPTTITYNAGVYANIEQSNLADPNSVWVVVSRGTGQVTTTENMPDRSVAVASPGRLDLYVQSARQAAIHGEQMTGQ